MGHCIKFGLGYVGWMSIIINGFAQTVALYSCLPFVCLFVCLHSITCGTVLHLVWSKLWPINLLECSRSFHVVMWPLNLLGFSRTFYMVMRSVNFPECYRTIWAVRVWLLNVWQTVQENKWSEQPSKIMQPRRTDRATDSQVIHTNYI